MILTFSPTASSSAACRCLARRKPVDVVAGLRAPDADARLREAAMAASAKSWPPKAEIVCSV
jgi:hypothetical protein